MAFSKKVQGLTQQQLAQACMTLSSGPSKYSTCTPSNCDKNACTKCPACRLRSGSSTNQDLDHAHVLDALGLY